MAYMSQEKKKELAPKIKEILANHGLKGSLRVRGHNTLCLNISSGKLSPPKHTYASAHHDITEEMYGEWCVPLNELKDAMMVGNHNHSNSMTDYSNFDWYAAISIGQWNKPYVQAA